MRKKPIIRLEINEFANTNSNYFVYGKWLIDVVLFSVVGWRVAVEVGRCCLLS